MTAAKDLGRNFGDLTALLESSRTPSCRGCLVYLARWADYLDPELEKVCEIDDEICSDVVTMYVHSYRSIDIYVRLQLIVFSTLLFSIASLASYVSPFSEHQMCLLVSVCVPVR